MRRLTILILSIISSSILFAQDYREVQGRVIDQDGHPVADARVVCNAECVCVTGADGLFNFRTTIYSRDIEVNVAGFITRRVDIDGSFLTVRLQKDLKYYEKLAAKQKAEEKARIAAEKDARSAEEKRIAEEEAAEAARVKAKRLAEKERVAEEAARIKAEEKAEERRIAEEEAAEAARVQAERLAEKERIAAESKEKIDLLLEKNKGWKHSVAINVSGAGPAAEKPSIGVEYIGGMRFNSLFFLGLGAGIAYNTYQYTLNKISVPLYANAKIYILNKRLQPYFFLSAGMKLSTSKEYFDVFKYNTSQSFVTPGIGVEYLLTSGSTVSLNIGYQATYMPFIWGEYMDGNIKYHSHKLFSGYNIQVGFTF